MTARVQEVLGYARSGAANGRRCECRQRRRSERGWTRGHSGATLTLALRDTARARGDPGSGQPWYGNPIDRRKRPSGGQRRVNVGASVRQSGWEACIRVRSRARTACALGYGYGARYGTPSIGDDSAVHALTRRGRRGHQLSAGLAQLADSGGAVRCGYSSTRFGHRPLWRRSVCSREARRASTGECGRRERRREVAQVDAGIQPASPWEG